MAINPQTQYPGKITPGNADYPYGAARNITSPGDGTGTPWEAALVNDLFGFQQSLLASAGLVPSGNPDKVGQSQYLDALLKLTRGTTDLLFLTVQDMQNGTAANGATVSFNDDQTLTALFYSTSIVTEWQVVASEPVGTWYVPLAGGKWAKLLEVDGDIRRYGGADDWDGASGTNNKPAVDYLYGKAPLTVRLPKTPEGTGVYLYDGANTISDASGVSVHADEGVSVTLTSGTISPLWLKGLKVNREVKSERQDLRFNNYMGPNAYSRPSEQSRMASASVGGVYRPEKIDLTTARNWTLTSWPNGSLTPATPVSSTDVDISWGALPALNFYLSSVPVAVGDHITAHVNQDVDLAALLVETDSGWVIINSASDSGGMQVTEKIGAANSTQWSFTESVLAQQSYSMNRAALGIIIFGTQSFGVTVNGVLLRRIDTDGHIISAGWGAGFENSGSSLTISRASFFKDKKTVGMKPLRIVGIGDSTSDDALAPSQYEYLQRYLAGACGAQVLELNNLAVAGQTSAQQLAILQATNIDNFDYCCIQIGVNDVQGGVPSLTYAANVEAMIDYCVAANVTPIVGLPTGYYLRSDAQLFGQDGQNTANANNVGVYRDVLLQVLADKGGVYVNPSVVEDEGAVLASLLGTDLDPVVSDNIHPTAYGQMVMGYSFAKSILGHATGSDRRGGLVQSPKDWWSGAVGTTTTPYYTAKGSLIAWSWFISTDGVTVNDGDQIGTLPPRFRPERDLYVSAVNTSAGSDTPTANPNALLRFSADGSVRAYNVDPAAVFVSFSATYEVSNA